MATTFLIENGDVVVSEAGGQTKLIADGDKLKQDIKEMLSTEARADNIGAGLEGVVGGRPADKFTIRAEISRRLRRAIATLQTLQVKFQRAERPIDERVRRLSVVEVQALEGSLSAFAFKVAVTTERGFDTSVSGVIS